jgi:DinB superfamily
MNDPVVRPAYNSWPEVNRRLRDVVATLTDEQLARRSTPEAWPLCAIVGHLACQRVFWLCDFAGEPGADTTPFTNAGYDCPGDDHLDHPLDGGQLAPALDATFRSSRHAWTAGPSGRSTRRSGGPSSATAG